MNRRPIRARESRWAASVAGALASAHIQPNTISLLSVLFAAGGGALIFASARLEVMGAVAALTVAPLLLELRLLCNLFDGMVAVEGGMKSPGGIVYNELPDRFSDALALILSGYAAVGPAAAMLGWVAALAAVLTAYVRALGSSAGTRDYFQGPMAKQHRMVVLMLGSWAAAMEKAFDMSSRALWLALTVIIVGCAITMVRRLRFIVHELSVHGES